jgi:lipopolysaccharide transport system ATP-binding protein
MTNVAVSAENLSKRYVVGRQRHHDTLTGTVAEAVSHVTSGKSLDTRHSADDFWALRDLSFTVAKGESLGIIGPNGAGKSTLLKMLARVVQPTSGTFTTVGRLGSVLEVGAGFHPELTGRENVMYNGSMLGLTRKELLSKMGSIFEFAEVEQFVDTPVKYYSSGMYIRLAFAIAAQLEPDILLIDEALAVGDVRFQQRCIDRMKQAASSGSTVLFVTHSTSFVAQLCDRALLISDGELRSIGPTDEVLAEYAESTNVVLKQQWTAPSDRSTTTSARDAAVAPISITVLDEDGYEHSGIVQRGEPLRVRLEFEVKRPSPNLSVGITIIDARQSLTRSTPFDGKEKPKTIEAGRHVWNVDVPTDLFVDGDYVIAFDTDEFGQDWVINPFLSTARTAFHVRGTAFDSRTFLWRSEREGAVKMPMAWSKGK